MDKKNTTIVWLELGVEKGQVMKLYAYDEIADWIDQSIEKENNVFIQGSIRNGNIEIEDIVKQNY